MTSISDLTPRELEILQLVIAGKTNKAIAKEIYISTKTVGFHLENIYRKPGIRTRLTAGIWALSLGVGPYSALDRLIGCAELQLMCLLVASLTASRFCENG